MQIRIFNNHNYSVPQDLLKKTEELITTSKLLKIKNRPANINLILLSEKQITELNKETFKRTASTDVISINNPDSDSEQLGDIYICPDVIKQNANQYGTSYDEEFIRITIHGILHLFGYDHKKQFGESKEEMFELQEQFVKEIV